jgi:hypothetical protein
MDFVVIAFVIVLVLLTTGLLALCTRLDVAE